MIETARKMADNLNVIISDSGKLLNEMADGNFAVATEHEERYTGKFNDLLVGIRNMNRKIDESLRQVEETAEQVSLGSGNMAGCTVPGRRCYGTGRSSRRTSGDHC